MDLYSSSASVVHELLANADDAAYLSKALEPSDPALVDATAFPAEAPEGHLEPKDASGLSPGLSSDVSAPTASLAEAMPTAVVTLRDGVLRFSSNEDGLRPEHVARARVRVRVRVRVEYLADEEGPATGACKDAHC